MARCLENLLGNVFGGKHLLSPRDAKVFSALTGVAIAAEHISQGDEMTLDVKRASGMTMVELLPELVDRTKKLINCDRASIFLLSEDKQVCRTCHDRSSETANPCAMRRRGTVRGIAHGVAGRRRAHSL